MKKITALLTVAALALFMFACKHEENTNVDTAGTDTAATATETSATDTSAMGSATTSDTSGTIHQAAECATRRSCDIVRRCAFFRSTCIEV